jgi:site-specific recombinase XerD
LRDVDPCVEHQPPPGRSWATINRRLKALKHFLDVGRDQQLVAGNPVQPSHVVRRGRPRPKARSREQVQRLFARIDHPRDRALWLVMRRGGRRVSEAAPLQLDQIDGEQQALPIVQGKGRQDRRVDLSPEAVASVHQGVAQHPGARARGDGLWHRTRHDRPRSVQAIPKQRER